MGAMFILLIIGVALAAAYLHHHRPLPDRAKVAVREVYLTAGGSLLDMRYRVTHPGRGLAAHDEIYAVGLDGRRIGEMMRVGKIDRLTARAAQQKRAGYLLLQNTARVNRGDRVSVVIGNSRQDGLIVT